MSFPYLSLIGALSFYYIGKSCEKSCETQLMKIKYYENLPTKTVQELCLEFDQHPSTFTSSPPPPIQCNIVGYTAQFPELLQTSTNTNSPLVTGLSKLVKLQVFESVYPTDPIQYGHEKPLNYQPYKIHRDYVELGSIWSADHIQVVDQDDIKYFKPTTHQYFPPSQTSTYQNGRYVNNAKFPKFFLTIPNHQLPPEMFELLWHEENLVDKLELEFINHSDNSAIELQRPTPVGTRDEEISVPLGSQVTMLGQFIKHPETSNIIMQPLINQQTNEIYMPILSPLPRHQILDNFRKEPETLHKISKICKTTGLGLGLYSIGQLLRIGFNSLYNGTRE